MNRQAFFNAARERPFGGSLSQGQVDGTNAILDEWERRGLSDARWLAYMLATAFHETGPASKAGHMKPIREYGDRAYFMRMYDKTGERPKVAATLGNTMVGDGAMFCGRGYVQLTGRANYAKASKALGIDLVGSPDRTLEPGIAAAIMFLGMTEGWFTTKRLSDYFSAGTTDWVNARRIINGTDRAAEIAGYAKDFYEALKLSAAPDATVPAPETETVAPPIPPPPDIEPPALDPEPVPPPPAKPQPDPAQEPKAGFWKWLLNILIAGLFQKGT